MIQIEIAVAIFQCRNYTKERLAQKWNVPNDGTTLRIKVRESMEREMELRQLSLPINFASRKKEARESERRSDNF